MATISEIIRCTHFGLTMQAAVDGTVPASSAVAGVAPAVVDTKVQAVDMDEIDLSALEGDLLTFTTASDPVSAEISAVFPDPLPAMEAGQDFFTAAAKEDAEQKANANAKSEADDAEKDVPVKSEGKKKKKKKKQQQQQQQQQKTDGEGRKEELRAKLRSRMSMQHELGGRGKLLNQLGVSMEDIADAAKEEASGKRVSQTKQDAVLGRAKNMFSSVFKGMDSKQKTYLSRKTDEVSGMATDLMKKLPSGPGKESSATKPNKRKRTVKVQLLPPHPWEVAKTRIMMRIIHPNLARHWEVLSTHNLMISFDPFTKNPPKQKRQKQRQRQRQVNSLFVLV